MHGFDVVAVWSNYRRITPVPLTRLVQIPQAQEEARRQAEAAAKAAAKAAKAAAAKKKKK